jgi:hypothetical protein
VILHCDESNGHSLKPSRSIGGLVPGWIETDLQRQ